MNPGETFHPSPNETFTCIRSGADGGAFVFEMELGPSGSGPPMHSHDEGDEVIEVLSGTIEFKLRDGWERYGPGETLTLTPSDPHTFRNPSGSESVRCLVSTGHRFERAIQPDLMRTAMYLVDVDPGASRMASPVIRATLWVLARIGRLCRLQLA